MTSRSRRKHPITVLNTKPRKTIDADGRNRKTTSKPILSLLQRAIGVATVVLLFSVQAALSAEPGSRWHGSRGEVVPAGGAQPRESKLKWRPVRHVSHDEAVIEEPVLIAPAAATPVTATPIVSAPPRRLGGDLPEGQGNTSGAPRSVMRMERLVMGEVRVVGHNAVADPFGDGDVASDEGPSTRYDEPETLLAPERISSQAAPTDDATQPRATPRGTSPRSIMSAPRSSTSRPGRASPTPDSEIQDSPSRAPADLPPPESPTEPTIAEPGDASSDDQSPSPSDDPASSGAEPAPYEPPAGVEPYRAKPSDEKLEEACEREQRDCREAIRLLNERTLRDVGLDIRVKGRLGEDYPCECVLSGGKYDERSWAPTTYTWKASGLCHKPLYFEEVALERYGHSHGCLVDPLVSGAHFFGTIPLLPYKMGLKPPCECEYSLGYYRPGNCAPHLLYACPFSWRAAAAEAAVVTGLVYAVP